MVSQISFVSVLALDEVVSAGTDQGEQVSLIDTLADKGIDRPGAWRARRRAVCSPRRSTPVRARSS